MDVKAKTALSGEFALIARYFAPLATAAGAAGLADDVATLKLAHGRELVLKTDAIVESVHFFRDDPADLVARKALRVNLSDLAAKGARPEGYLLALALAPWVDNKWVEKFAAGLKEDQELFGISLQGGDTDATPGPVTITITALGSIDKGRIVRRKGAKAGDCVFVSGTIGDAGGGLAVLKGEGGLLSPKDKSALVSRYRLPDPRLALGRKLVGLASASLDVSDGLIADLGHIAEVSGVRIVVEAARVPLSPALRALWGDSPQTVQRAATSGDDYEIAFTASPAARRKIASAAAAVGVSVHEIGRVEKGAGAVLVDETSKPIRLSRKGYTHF